AAVHGGRRPLRRPVRRGGGPAGLRLGVGAVEVAPGGPRGRPAAELSVCRSPPGGSSAGPQLHRSTRAVATEGAGAIYPTFGVVGEGAPHADGAQSVRLRLVEVRVRPAPGAGGSTGPRRYGRAGSVHRPALGRVDGPL